MSLLPQAASTIAKAVTPILPIVFIVMVSSFA
jgi:hypothetical protein